MGQQRRYNRKWDTRNFVAGGTEIINLPIGLDCESIQFYLAGSINVTTAYTTCKTEGLAKLIKKVDLLYDGKTVASLTGDILTHGNFARAGGLIKTNPGVTVANQTCEIVGFLDLANIGGVRAKDSSLRTLGARQFQLAIQWGQLSDMFTGAGAATTALTLKTSIRETLEPVDGFAPEALRLYRFQEKTYAANTQDRIRLDPNVLYRGIMLRCETSGDLSAAVLNNAKIQIGSEIPFDLDAAQIVDTNIQDNGFALPTGYYFIDFAPAPTGLVKIADFLNTENREDAFLILDVNGAATTKVQMVAHEFEYLHHHVEFNREQHQSRG